ncbi:MAG: von Willebrand factor type A domain-containing protein [Planctomycetia bacterium]|nr:von Willebrand factor type A domain-containing protein [Planctomycetia bacterium]
MENNNQSIPETENTDPRITAYLLDELNPEEKTAFEEEISKNPDLQKELDSFRSTMETIKSALRNEPLPADSNAPQISKDASFGKSRSSWSVRRWIAAALLVFLTVLGTSHWYSTQNKEAVRLIVPIDEYKKSDTVSAPGDIKENVLPTSEIVQTEKQLTGSIKATVKDSSKAQREDGADQIEGKPAPAPVLKKDEAAKSKRENYKPGTVPTKPAKSAPAPASAPSVGMSMSSAPMNAPESPSPSFTDRDRMDGMAMGIMPQGKRKARGIIGNDSGNSVLSFRQERETEMNMYRQPPVPRFVSRSEEGYRPLPEKPFVSPKEEQFSTFSIDVDTASYSNIRRFIKAGQTPPSDAVRIEELINYFKYDYPGPAKDSKEPFATNVEVASCPWAENHLLARIGIKGKEIPKEKRPPLHLVFLIDVSGSMSSSNKLPLVKRGLAELVEELRDGDEIAIVIYAGSARVHLKSTPGSETARILNAIDELRAGGSTAGAQGIQTAYEIARKQYKKGEINRIVLCTDGDFNVGTTDNNELEKMIEKEAKSGIYLSILGFGMGNYKDDRLSILSNKGNGNYGYIDSIAEARKLLVDQLTGTLITIAKDVKIQVEFNPNRVAGYRLLGYDDRRLAAEDFNNDKKDAGEIGAGHTITALYEIVPVGIAVPNAGRVDEPRYAAKKDESKSQEKKENPSAESKEEFNDELMFVKLRYKLPEETKSSLLKSPVVYKKGTKSSASADFRFASAVALFGLILKESSYTNDADLDTAVALAKEALGKDCKDAWKNEFVDLVKQYRSEKEAPDRSNQN